MPTRDRSPFGSRLRQARIDAGLTQPEVAARLKISQGTLSELEKQSAGSAHTAALAKLYGVDAHWLATGHGSAREPEPAMQASMEAQALGRLIHLFGGMGPAQRGELMAAAERLAGVARAAEVPDEPGKSKGKRAA